MKCFLCDKEFESKIRAQRFCGKECSKEYYGDYLIPRKRNPFKSIGQDPYFNPDKDPKLSRAYARRIYKKTYGPIKKGFDVHHIDFNPLNNTIENLIAIPEWLHFKVHRNKVKDRALIEKLL